MRSDGSVFASEEDCTSYGAQGGTVTADPHPEARAVCVSYGGTFRLGGADPRVLWTCGDIPYTSDEDLYAVARALSRPCVESGGGLLLARHDFDNDTVVVTCSEVTYG